MLAPSEKSRSEVAACRTPCHPLREEAHRDSTSTHAGLTRQALQAHPTDACGRVSVMAAVIDANAVLRSLEPAAAAPWGTPPLRRYEVVDQIGQGMYG